MYGTKITNLYKAGIGAAMGSSDLLRDSEPLETYALHGALEQTHADLVDTVMSLKSGQSNLQALQLSDGNSSFEKEKAALEAGLYAITEGVSLQSVQQQTGANNQLLTEGFEQAAKLLNIMQSDGVNIYSNSDTVNVVLSQVISDQLKERNISPNQFMQASVAQQEPSNNWQNFVASQRQNAMSQERTI